VPASSARCYGSVAADPSADVREQNGQAQNEDEGDQEQGYQPGLHWTPVLDADVARPISERGGCSRPSGPRLRASVGARGTICGTRSFPA
jgi:hypothetical protein